MDDNTGQVVCQMSTQFARFCGGGRHPLPTFELNEMGRLLLLGFRGGAFGLFMCPPFKECHYFLIKCLHF